MTEWDKISRLIDLGYSVSIKLTDKSNFSEKFKVFKHFRIGDQKIEEIFVVNDHGEVIDRADV